MLYIWLKGNQCHNNIQQSKMFVANIRTEPAWEIRTHVCVNLNFCLWRIVHLHFMTVGQQTTLLQTFLRRINRHFRLTRFCSESGVYVSAGVLNEIYLATNKRTPDIKLLLLLLLFLLTTIKCSCESCPDYYNNEFRANIKRQLRQLWPREKIVPEESF